MTPTATTPAPAVLSAAPPIRWDDSKMQTRYANAVQVTATREEVVILLGTHQVWQGRDVKDVKEVVVPLEERILLGPQSAKRMLVQLALVVAAYESRYGKLTEPSALSDSAEAVLDQ